MADCSDRITRPCPACGGKRTCRWVDDAWVCRRCGSEWYPDREAARTLSADEFALPDRIAVDAKGYGWRVWDGSDFWSMVPTNPDNSPIPQPVTWFVRADHWPNNGREAGSDG